MPRLRVEFTVEPFVAGEPGPHVLAAQEAVREAGFEPHVGPFGTTVEGDGAEALAALHSALSAAVAAGATAVAVQVEKLDEIAASEAEHPLAVALAGIARAVGGSVIGREGMDPGDIPVEWEGEVVIGLRLPTRTTSLISLIGQVEACFDIPLAELSREDKQRAVRMLDERGAFQLRRSMDDVADVLGVSRITVYNYLNAVRRQ